MKRDIIKGLTCVAALLLALFICVTLIGVKYEGSINAYFGVQTGTVSGATAEYVYKTDFTDDGRPSEEGLAALLAAEDEFNKTVMEDSAVLVYNNGALPLASDERNVTLLGRATVDPVWKCGSAGAEIEESRVVTFSDAMTSAGFTVNEDLLDAYAASGVTRTSGTDIGEVDGSFYTDAIVSTFADHNDVGIVLLSRLAGEGIDASRNDVDGKRLLELHDQEKELLKVANANFDKVVVILNSAYALELDWLYDEEYGVDACLWMGNPGLSGFAGIPSLLTGETSPSGHFTDTYAAYSLSSPAAQNDGSKYMSDGTTAFAVYAEGIYVGYKYYETRYEDLILGRYNADSTAGAFMSTDAWNYADEVTFPFGYGLSYTTFEQTLDSVTRNDDGTITITVTVTNVGDTAGKSVVQVYAQTPYTEYDRTNNIEKSAVQLLDFAKTDVLEANGGHETVEIVADEYLIASWDDSAYDGEGSYILDDGTYYIAIGDNAHDALNNILAAKGASGMYDENGESVSGDADKVATYTKDTFDDTTYKTTEAGQTVGNKLEGLWESDYNEFNTGNSVTYLTRKDWTTFPVTYETLEITSEMQDIHDGDFYEELKAIVGEPEYSLDDIDQEDTLLFIDMVGESWDSDKWEPFLLQMSVSELSLIMQDSWGQAAITSISKPHNYQTDGPDGGATQYSYQYNGETLYNTMYVNQGTQACSWNKELMARRGYFLAEDAFYNGSNCTMAPGVNIHRTPYSGRNHEYYSEDGTFSYLMGAVQVAAMQEKGTVAMLKHIAGNDFETNRVGVCCFMTEQAYRESSLKGFEGCIVKGGAMSAMAGFNCIGMCKLARNYGILTGIVRDEWDWKGFIDTDANDCADTFAATVLAGTDEFCLDTTVNMSIMNAINKGDDYLLSAVIQSNKRFYYTYASSNLINGLTHDTVVGESEAWWQVLLIVLDVVFGIVAVAGLATYCVLLVMKKQRLGANKECDIMNYIKNKLASKGVPGIVAYALCLVSLIVDIVFIAVDVGDVTFSTGCFVCVLVGSLIGLADLFTDKTAGVFLLVASMLFSAGLAFHLYAGLPSLSDLMNNVNFIGGNQAAAIGFGIVFIVVTLALIVINFMKTGNKKHDPLRA